MSDGHARKAPVHLWVIGILAFLWNLMGAVDYVMTETRNEAYMSQYTPEQLEFFYGFPAWVIALWAIAVWGGVLGAVLLLLRKRLAAPVFLASFVCMVVTTIQNYGFAGAAEIAGTMEIAFSAVIFVVALGLVIYSRRMAASGALS